MSGVDSHLSVIHRPNRFIDVVDEEWVTHQLPSETLFRNVSEFDDDDDDFAAASVNGAASDALDHFAMLGAAAPHVSAAINAPPDDASGVFRWNDLALAPFLASAPQRPQPPINQRND
jgi:hypothetical protein